MIEISTLSTRRPHCRFVAHAALSETLPRAGQKALADLFKTVAGEKEQPDHGSWPVALRSVVRETGQ